MQKIHYNNYNKNFTCNLRDNFTNKVVNEFAK